jgi:hypothetical protein
MGDLLRLTSLFACLCGTTYTGRLNSLCLSSSFAALSNSNQAGDISTGRIANYQLCIAGSKLRGQLFACNVHMVITWRIQ